MAFVQINLYEINIDTNAGRKLLVPKLLTCIEKGTTSIDAQVLIRSVSIKQKSVLTELDG